MKFNRQFFIEVSYFLLIALFAYTGSSKLLGWFDFRGQLSQHPFIGQYHKYLFWSVPAIELIVAVLLVIPKTKPIGRISSLSLLILFTVYIIFMMLAGGKDLPCTCGGVISHFTWGQHVFFNLGFIGINVFLNWTERKKSRSDSGKQSRLAGGVA